MIINTLSYSNQIVKVINIDKTKLPVIKVKVKINTDKWRAKGEKYFKVQIDGKDVKFKLNFLNRKVKYYFFLIDISGSIKRGKLSQIKKAAVNICNNLPQRSSVAIYFLHDYLEKATDFISDKKLMVKAIQRAKTKGRYSRIYDALLYSANTIRKKIKSKVSIVLFSDGLDEGSKYKINQVVRVLKKKNIVVLSHGFTNKNEKYLENLKLISKKSGGRYTKQTDENIVYAKTDKIEKGVYVFTIYSNKKSFKTLRIIPSGVTPKQAIKIDFAKYNYKLIIIIAAIALALIILIVLILVLRKRQRKGKGSARLSKEDKNTLFRIVSAIIKTGKDTELSYFKHTFKPQSISSEEIDKLIVKLKQAGQLDDDLTEEKIKKLFDKISIISEKEAIIKYNELFHGKHIKEIRDALNVDRDIGISEYLKKINKSIHVPEHDILHKVINRDETKEIQDFLNKVSPGNNNFDMDSIFKSLFEADKSDNAKFMPLMIDVVKNAKGFAKDASLNIFKRMGQNIDLKTDDITDPQTMDSWWDKNKSEVMNKLNELTKKEAKSKLENGLFINENIELLSEHGQDFNLRILSGDKYSFNGISNKDVLVDEITCFYRPGFPDKENVLFEKGYIFAEVFMISLVEDFFEISFQFLPPGKRNDEKVRKIINRL